MQPFAVRPYLSFLDLRRDLTSLEQAFDLTTKKLAKFNRLFNVAHLMVDAPVRRQQAAKLVHGLRHLEIQKNFGVVASLQQQISCLDNMLHYAEHEFVGEKAANKAALEMKNLQRLIKTEFEKASATVEKLAKNVVPPQFKNWTSRLQQEVQAKLKVVPVTRMLAAVIDKKLHYVVYSLFENATDKSGFVYPEYYLILTMLASGGKNEYAVTASSTFRMPGQYRLGETVSIFSTLQDRVSKQLNTDKF